MIWVWKVRLRCLWIGGGGYLGNKREGETSASVIAVIFQKKSFEVGSCPLPVRVLLIGLCRHATPPFRDPPQAARLHSPAALDTYRVFLSLSADECLDSAMSCSRLDDQANLVDLRLLLNALLQAE
jgi:hypothetical protein